MGGCRGWRGLNDTGVEKLENKREDNLLINITTSAEDRSFSLSLHIFVPFWWPLLSFSYSPRQSLHIGLMLPSSARESHPGSGLCAHLHTPKWQGEPELGWNGRHAPDLDLVLSLSLSLFLSP